MAKWKVIRTKYIEELDGWEEIEEEVVADSVAHDEEGVWFYKSDRMRLVAAFSRFDSIRLIEDDSKKCCGRDCDST